MFNKIEIKNFKCFKKFNLEKLKRINLIFGKNNSGKTVFLEAIFLLFSNGNPRQILSLLRGMPVAFPFQQEVWSILFSDLELSKIIEISGMLGEFKAEVRVCSPISEVFTVDPQFLVPENALFLHWKYNAKELKAYLTYNEKFVNFFPTFGLPFSIISVPPALDPFLAVTSGNLKSPIVEIFFHTCLGRMDVQYASQIFGEIVRKGHKKLVVSLLSELDNSIEDVELMSFNGSSIVGVKIKDKFYPINQLGEGFYRIFVLACIFIQKMEGIVLIDEIENGIYYEIQPILWKWLLEFSKRFNVQVFITTHSREFIVNAIENTENFEEIQGIRFEREEEEIFPVIIEGEELKELVEKEYEFR